MSENDGSDIYGVERWGDGCVTKLDNGELGLLNPLSPEQPPISLLSIITNLEARGIQTPVLIRVASY